MLKENVGNVLNYTKLSPEEQKKRGILGRLVGIMADFKHPTRNGRLYNEELWDKTFKDPLMQEKIKNRVILGELGHPENRTEIDMEKVAICLAEEPKKFSDGTIQGVFDILDTPNGKILKTLCDYGCKVGVSSRGSGDILESWDGENDTVDPDSYTCECWDVVLVPAVKNARPEYVNESLQKPTLKKALTEAYNKASSDDKKVMKETFNKLEIELKVEEKDDSKKECEVPKAGEDTEEKQVEETAEIEEEVEKVAAEDDGAIVEQLQQALKAKAIVENKLLDLQEKLSVCYAKEVKYKEELSNYKNVAVNLTRSLKEAKALKEENDSLKEQLSSQAKVIKRQENRLSGLNESLGSVENKVKSLNESINLKKERIEALKESLTKQKEIASKTEESLQENLEEIKQNSIIKVKEYSDKLAKANSLVEHYKKVAQLAVNRYIESKAGSLGISTLEVKNRLNENYSFKDIDRVCNELESYKINIGKLPFKIDESKELKAKVTESFEPIKGKNRFDDTVDDSLLRMSKGN